MLYPNSPWGAYLLACARSRMPEATARWSGWCALFARLSIHALLVNLESVPPTMFSGAACRRTTSRISSCCLSGCYVCVHAVKWPSFQSVSTTVGTVITWVRLGQTNYEIH